MSESRLRLAFLLVVLSMGLTIGYVTNLVLLTLGLLVGFALLCIIFMKA